MSYPLTFGVEMEFLVPFLITPDADPEPFDARQIDRVPASYDEEDDNHFNNALEMISKRQRATLTAAGLPAARRVHLEAMPSQWDVDSDPTLHPTEAMEHTYGRNWMQMEVVSPVLPTNGRGYGAAEQACLRLATYHRVHTPPTCGLHVHVGNGREGFTVPTLQNLAAFLWTFEPQLASLQPRHRQGSKYCQSMRQRANISVYFPDLVRGIRKIYSLSNVRNLVALVRPTDDSLPIQNSNHFFRFMSYNFQNLVVDGGKKTVEFRQFEGTMNSVDVGHWIRVCCGIVHYCKELDMFTMMEFLRLSALRKQSHKNRMDLGELLTRVGLPEQAAWAVQRAARV